VKTLKNELAKKDDFLVALKQGKTQAKIQELEYEVEIYREELLRLRSLLQNPDSAN
jgi:hypothetical protein